MNNQRIQNTATIMIDALRKGHAKEPADLLNLFNQTWPEPSVEEGVSEFLSWCNIRTALCMGIWGGYDAGRNKPA